ncbi:DUF4065 domain-containing protein [Spirosoma sp. KCTC 42546]|uniref:Panacea domain-containing protein n=1 Tax=Spirosoma sp. KCTC 42546 TaxID=2520506 RepID=UPI00115A7BBE|nr:type II toxin-antitoxin system antitoxin SocA domain-containing protein [Spirosoma sp. KCTC 42546]QDK79755.1 DUF4065 domain-containing protein [Spirosoma sp. KCTC 42546]
MLSASQVAEYLLGLSRPEVGDTISNLKLQKLLYYCQGLHLAMYGKPLFSEQIFAWNYGPVVAEVYSQYKHFGAKGIDVPDEINTSVFNDEQEELMNDVYELFGQFSALKLMEMTHEESPWRTTAQNSEITHDKMVDYFKTLLNTVDE